MSRTPKQICLIMALLAVVVGFQNCGGSGSPEQDVAFASKPKGKQEICHFQEEDGAYKLLIMGEKAALAHTEGHPFDRAKGAYYTDSDGDGFGDPDSQPQVCPGEGLVDNNTDCDIHNPNLFVNREITTTETIESNECSNCINETVGNCKNSVGLCTLAGATARCPRGYATCPFTIEEVTTVTNVCSGNDPNTVVAVGAAGAEDTGVLYRLFASGHLQASGVNKQYNYGLDGISRNVFTMTLANVAKFAAGDGFTLAVKKDGSLWAVGSNEFGQLGLGDTVNRNKWTRVSGVSNVVDLQASGKHTFLLKSDNTLWTAGEGASGALGSGAIENLSRFTQVLTDVVRVATGPFNTLAIKVDGTLWGAGQNSYGELGLGDEIQRNSFVKLPLGSASSVAVGKHHTLVTGAFNALSGGALAYAHPKLTLATWEHNMIRVGYLYGAGDASRGQLGSTRTGAVNNTFASLSPTDVDNAILAEFIFAGGDSSYYTYSNELFMAGDPPDRVVYNYNTGSINPMGCKSGFCYTIGLDAFVGKNVVGSYPTPVLALNANASILFAPNQFSGELEVYPPFGQGPSATAGFNGDGALGLGDNLPHDQGRYAAP